MVDDRADNGRREAGSTGYADLSASLRQLVKDPGQLNPNRLWKALRPDERLNATKFFLEVGDRDKIIAIVASVRKSRRETIRKWPNVRIAEAMQVPSTLKVDLVTRLLVTLHVVGRREMLDRFLVLLGVSDEKDLVKPANDVPPPDEGTVHRAANTLAADYGVRYAALYFCTLLLRSPSIAGPLRAWMGGLAKEADSGEEDARVHAGSGPEGAGSNGTLGEGWSESSETDEVLGSPRSEGQGAGAAAVEEGKGESDEGEVSAPIETGDAPPLTRGSSATPGNPEGRGGREGGVGPQAANGTEGRGAPATTGAARPVGDAVDPSANRDAPEGHTEATDGDDQLMSAGGAPESFTTLDRMMRDAALDAAQGVIGSLTRKQIDEAVGEFVRLNGRRPRSYFHKGFCDTLFDQLSPDELPAQNRDRERWYWAGAIQGWARSESWPSIVREYDGRPVVRDLGDGSDPASAEAVENLVRALRGEDRTAELTHFVKTPAIVASLDLFKMLLEAATDLLRADDAAEARQILDLLVEAAEVREENGDPPGTPLFLEARRRQAHCLRHLGEHLRAKAILDGLLDLDPDPNVRAMLQADLGLLEGGFNKLVDVRLRNQKEDLERILESVEKGEEHFRKSIAQDVRYASHGHYCLGVLALGREKYESAGRHLKQARAEFRSQTSRYGERLVARTDLYFGIANVCSLSEEGLTRGPGIMVKALNAGARFPSCLIESTVVALGMGRSSKLCEVAEAILWRGKGSETLNFDESVLDVLAESSAAKYCASLRKALLDRARRNDRSGESVARDLRSALPGFFEGGDHETAAEILDELEGLARRGVGLQDFMDLLEPLDRYDPAWSRDDAAVALAHCHEARGKYPEATEVLRELFHQFANQETEAGLHNAEGVLTKVKQFGIDPSYYQGMQQRYNALAPGFAEVESDPDDRPVRVLIVGGNEAQAKRTDAVRAKLKRTHPNLAVQFVQTGWRSNWQKPLEEFCRKLPVHDGVVIMRFMRTELGKRIRKECGKKPWRFCWGPGSTAQAEAVIKVAKVADPPHSGA